MRSQAGAWEREERGVDALCTCRRYPLVPGQQPKSVETETDYTQKFKSALADLSY